MLTVDGGWTTWTEWTDCACADQSQTRERVCSVPEPQVFGMICLGDGIEDMFCDCGTCPSKRIMSAM